MTSNLFHRIITCTIIMLTSLSGHSQTSILFTDNSAEDPLLIESLSKEAGVHLSADKYIKVGIESTASVGNGIENYLRKNPSDDVSVVLLQIGCNGSGLNKLHPCISAEQTLFHFPFAYVCNLKGERHQHKRMAVSRKEVTNNDVVGVFYNAISAVRKLLPQARIFILSPIIQTGRSSSSEHTSKFDGQLAAAAQLFCIPYVTDICKDLAPFQFIWNKNVCQSAACNILILGDSYSEQHLWTDHLQRITGYNIVNLAVGSATLRDRFDFHTHPYSAHPVKTDNAGNHNTLACQIEKLKRLQRGETDSLEQALPLNYSPDIILIEGGTNDNADSDATEKLYHQSSVQADRTTFVGSIAYLSSALKSIYPNAKIFVVTPSGLYYGHTDAPFAYIDKARQIRRASKILGLSTIDWDRNGRLSFVFNNSHAAGKGTKRQPYRYDVPTQETKDLLHPNEHGALFLAEAVAAVLFSQQ